MNSKPDPKKVAAKAKASAETDDQQPMVDDVMCRFADALDEEFVPDEIIEEFLLNRAEQGEKQVTCPSDKEGKKFRPTIANLTPPGESHIHENVTQPGVVWVKGIDNCEGDNSEDSLDYDDIEIPASVLQRFSTRGSLVSRGSLLDENIPATVLERFPSRGSFVDEEIPATVLQRFSSRGSFVSRSSFREEEYTVRRLSGFSCYDLDDEYIVEAETVEEGRRSPVVIDAKPMQWWKRNQWCLTAMIVAVTIGITLGIAVAFRSQIQLNDSVKRPETRSNMERIRQTIISQCPQAEEKLRDQSTLQYGAVNWVTEQANLYPDFYNERRLLQQYSLVVFFLSTHGLSSWRNGTRWMEASDECQWHGVKCGKKGSAFENMIIGLELTSNGLSGSLPDDIIILSSSLSNLALDDNSLSGSIPNEIGQLTLLSNLSLSRNRITGRIPAYISTLVNLVFLDLSQNSLSSTIPTEIGILSGLQSIQLGRNELVGSIPPEIGRLTYLQEMDLQKNELSYAIPTEIGHLSTLERLHLQENKLLGPLPFEISSLSGLQIMDLSRNYVFGEIPKSLWQTGSLPKLQYFDLSYNLLTGSLPNDFGISWQGLRTLRIGGRNFLQGTIPQAVLSSTLLEELDVSSNFFTGTISDKISRLLNLNTLDLSSNNLHGKLPEDLYDLKMLQSLDVSGNKLEGGLSSSIGGLSNLDLFGVSGVSGFIPAELWLLTRLETLVITHASLSNTMPPDIGLLSSLRKINFFMMSDSSLGTLPSELGLLTSLTELNVAHNGIPGSLPREIELLSNLKTLDMRNNRLSGNIPSGIAHLTSLESVHLMMNGMTGTVPTQIGTLTNLETLNLGVNLLQGSIPSEIGKLTNLEYFNVAITSVEGALPSEIRQCDKLKTLLLYTTDLDGSIPEELCNINPQPDLKVECENVVCHCCGCPQFIPSGYPSFSPMPTQTLVQSPIQSSSFSVMPIKAPWPSTSPLVSSNTTSLDTPSLPIGVATSGVCSAFTPISSRGSLLPYDNGSAVVDLPFPFTFNVNGGEEYSNVTVLRDKGELRMGSDKNHLMCGRVIIAAQFLKDEMKAKVSYTGGSLFTAYDDKERSFTVSWENVSFGAPSNYNWNFQIVLFADGRIEVRWGDGIYPSIYQLLSLVAVPCQNHFFPMNAEPFLTSKPSKSNRLTEYGIWPSNQCALFSPKDEGYTVNQSNLL
mmetsp:Transcript_30306/g.46268  ORF Transcript_30306/g.46268 Transcript_30306/m.46268 type:complete len:1197 (+) Transcript_30306:126-3716(+)